MKDKRKEILKDLLGEFGSDEEGESVAEEEYVEEDYSIPPEEDEPEIPAEEEEKFTLDKIMKKLPKNSDDILILGIKDYSSTKLVNNDLFIREGNIKLYDYFKISQISLDLHNIFTEIGSFIHFCKKIGVELDISVLNKSDKLLSFVSNFQPFKLEFIPNEDGVLVEGNKKNIDAKFNEFKKSINRAIKII